MNLDKLLEDAFARHRSGDLAGAARLYGKVLVQQPNHDRCLYLMGTLQVQSGRPDRALPLLTRAAQRNPQAAEVQDRLGSALRGLGDMAGAEAAHRRAVALEPRNGTFHNNLGVVLQELGRAADAAECFQAAVRLLPDFVSAHSNLGAALKEMRVTDKAVEHFKRAMELDPAQLGALINLSLMLQEKGDLETAGGYLRKALAAAPHEPDVVATMASYQERMGNHEAGWELVLPLIEAGTEHPKVVAAFGALARRLKREAEAISLIDRVVSRPGLPQSARIRLDFVAGNLYDRMGEYDKAFARYAEGNRLAGRVRSFDPSADNAYTDRIITQFSRERMAALPRATGEGDFLVFILGMPRSGTTLVEQILSSHPGVFGGDERPEMPQLVEGLPHMLGVKAPYPDCIEHLNADVLAQVSRMYRTSLRALSPDALRITDKLPHNFLYLGMIALACPEARVVHCTRDPLDTCLSIYFQLFASPHPYSYDLAHLGVHYRNYRRLMRHWVEELGLPVHEVCYETMVADQEAESRKLVDYAGLDWDDACLSFHDSERYAKTASYDQVRQPIYTRSVERWRHYESHLGPLFDALGDELPEGTV
ncbi:MAG: sulfotransferase [Leptospirillia bacterium]